MRAEAMLIAHNPEWCAKNVRRLWRVIKAMRTYRKEHPRCEITGRKGVHVHHIEPVHVRPDLADDPANFISLCPKAHEIVGHGGNWKHWNPRVVTDSQSLRIGIERKETA